MPATRKVARRTTGSRAPRTFLLSLAARTAAPKSGGVYTGRNKKPKKVKGAFIMPTLEDIPEESTEVELPSMATKQKPPIGLEQPNKDAAPIEKTNTGTKPAAGADATAAQPLEGDNPALGVTGDALVPPVNETVVHPSAKTPTNDSTKAKPTPTAPSKGPDEEEGPRSSPKEADQMFFSENRLRYNVPQIYNSMSFDPDKATATRLRSAQKKELKAKGYINFEHGVHTPACLIDYLNPIAQHELQEVYRSLCLERPNNEKVQKWDYGDYEIIYPPPNKGQIPDDLISRLIESAHATGDAALDFELHPGKLPKLKSHEQRGAVVFNKDAMRLFGCGLSGQLIDFYVAWRHRTTRIGQELVHVLPCGPSLNRLYAWYGDRGVVMEDVDVLTFIWELAHPASYQKYVDCIAALSSPPKKKKKGKSHPRVVIPGNQAWNFDLFELPLICFPLGRDGHYVAHFVCNANIPPVRGQKKLRPFIVRCDSVEQKTRIAELPEWPQFICWFLSCCWEVKTWIHKNSITKKTKFSPETRPDASLFTRFKTSMKSNSKDSCRYDPLNTPAHSSEAAPHAGQKASSGVYTCLNISAAMQYARAFDDGTKDHQEFPGEPFESVHDFDKRIMAKQWEGSLQGREISFRRNLHLLFMACKAANVAKFAIRGKAVDKRYQYVLETRVEYDSMARVGQLLMVSILYCECAVFNSDLVLVWSAELCEAFFDYVVEAKSLAFYDRLMRSFYLDMDDADCTENSMETAALMIQALRKCRSKHMKAVREGFVEDHPDTAIREDYPRLATGEFLSFAPLDATAEDVALTSDADSVVPPTVTQTQEGSDKSALSTVLDPKLTANLEFQQWEYVGGQIMERMLQHHESFDFVILAEQLQKALQATGNRTDYEEKLLGLLPENVFTKLFALACLGKEEFAYSLKSKQDWIIDGIKCSLRERRIERFGIGQLEPSPTKDKPVKEPSPTKDKQVKETRRKETSETETEMSEEEIPAVKPPPTNNDKPAVQTTTKSPLGTSGPARAGVENLRNFFGTTKAGAGAKPERAPETSKPPADIFKATDGSLTAKSHILYEKITSKDKQEFKDGMAHISVRPELVETAMKRAKRNWKAYIPDDAFEEPPVGELPSYLRDEVRHSGRASTDRPRTEGHFKGKQNSMRINVLLDDLDVLNSVGSEGEKKRARKNWDEFFPSTQTMGLDAKKAKKKSKKMGKEPPSHNVKELERLDAENKQVERIVWYTKSDREDHFRGLLRHADNSTSDIALSTEWCNLNFNPLFLQLVILSGRKWPSQKKWVPVPAGNSRDGLSGELGDIVDFDPAAESIYQQGDNDTCLIHSFCSALHYVGLVKVAKNLAASAQEYEILPCDLQFRKLVGYVKTNIPKEFIRAIETTTKAHSAAKIDIYCPLENSVNVVVIKTTDGACDHAITTVKLRNGRPLVFDSNDRFGMKLNLKTLNHCSGHHTEYSCVRQYIGIVLKPRNIEKMNQTQV